MGLQLRSEDWSGNDLDDFKVASCDPAEAGFEVEPLVAMPAVLLEQPGAVDEFEPVSMSVETPPPNMALGVAVAVPAPEQGAVQPVLCTVKLVTL